MLRIRIVRCGIFIGVMGLFYSYAHAQLRKEDSATLAYIEKYKNLAISEMRRTGMPAAIKIAQGLVETQAGMGDLVLRSNNHFGLKCKRAWTGERVFYDDDAVGECFRKYSSDSLSYIDQSNYLKNSKKYQPLFTSLDPLNYKAWAHGLKKAGYATNPKYVAMLITKIEDWGLQKYSLMALREEGKMNEKEYNKLLANVLFRKDKVRSDATLFATTNTDKGRIGKKAISSSFSDAFSDNVKMKYHLAVTVSMEKEYAAIAQSTNSTSSNTTYNFNNTTQLQTFLAKEKLVRINNRKAISVPKGMSLLAIAFYYDIPYASILLYNDFPPDANVTLQNQYIFIRPKRNKAQKQEFHIVQKNQTLYDIAQIYGVYLHKIQEYNYLSPGMEPRPEEKIYLRSNAPLRPAIY